MRIDKGSQMVAFDNMQDRPIKRTTGWHNCLSFAEILAVHGMSDLGRSQPLAVS
jgi:hypothetical protein